jgi:SNF family Na+-dependent transporter
MFHILKNIIWIVGFMVVAGFVLNYFGYEINKNYFQERKGDCQQKLKECQSDLLHQGLDNAKCNFNCLDPKFIIRKK